MTAEEYAPQPHERDAVRQIHEVVQWFGLKFKCCAPPSLVVGTPPTCTAFDLNGVLYKPPPHRIGDVGDVLHEAVHAVLGPETLYDEAVLMAYEYSAARNLLQRDAYFAWRDVFSVYGFDWTDASGYFHTELGDGAEVFASAEWRDECYGPAHTRKWLDVGGKPRQITGIHPEYRKHHTRKRLIPPTAEPPSTSR